MTFADFILRLLLSIGLGFSIGLERQITGHLAGIRINILICMGSCMFLLFPMIMGSSDIYRIASYIVSGVGFLCSGVIFKESGTVRGLNTAATLWCTAAIGTLASSGLYNYAIATTAILILSNLIFRPLSRKVKVIGVGASEELENTYRISVSCFEEVQIKIREQIIAYTTRSNLLLVNMENSDIIGDRVEIRAEFICFGNDKMNVLEQIVSQLLQEGLVIQAGWEIV